MNVLTHAIHSDQIGFSSRRSVWTPTQRRAPPETLLRFARPCRRSTARRIELTLEFVSRVLMFLQHTSITLCAGSSSGKAWPDHTSRRGSVRQILTCQRAALESELQKFEFFTSRPSTLGV